MIQPDTMSTILEDSRHSLDEPPAKKTRIQGVIIADVDMDTTMTEFLDNTISKLINAGSDTTNLDLSEEEIIAVAEGARKRMRSEPMLLQVKPPVNLCGDIHGQYDDLLRLFKKGGWPPNTHYLFLGDYVDRGDKSVEVITLLLAFKARFPDQVHLLRGNHESRAVNKRYTFYNECVQKYSKKLYGKIVNCFNMMPVAAIVGERIFCVHGGLSPRLNHVSQINRIKRPSEVPTTGLLCDLLWADPSENADWFEPNNDRGISYIFGNDAIQRFLKRNDLELICRAHEVAMRGFKFFKKQRQLVTLFSAPKYDGYNNKAAIMTVSTDLTVRFKILT